MLNVSNHGRTTTTPWSNLPGAEFEWFYANSKMYMPYMKNVFEIFLRVFNRLFSCKFCSTCT